MSHGWGCLALGKKICLVLQNQRGGDRCWFLAALSALDVGVFLFTILQISATCFDQLWYLSSSELLNICKCLLARSFPYQKEKSQVKVRVVIVPLLLPLSLDSEGDEMLLSLQSEEW